MTYDLVIKNGIVVDGTGAKRYQADVAIADGKVAEIGKVTEGAKRTSIRTPTTMRRSAGTARSRPRRGTA